VLEAAGGVTENEVEGLSEVEDHTASSFYPPEKSWLGDPGRWRCLAHLSDYGRSGLLIAGFPRPWRSARWIWPQRPGKLRDLGIRAAQCPEQAGGAGGMHTDRGWERFWTGLPDPPGGLQS
jgi:hypothetical protein